VTLECAAAFLDDDARHEPRRAGVGVRRFDRHDVRAGEQQFFDVVHIHLPPVVALPSNATVDVQLVLVVTCHVNLSELGVLQCECFTEIALPDWHFVLSVGGRPDPTGADKFQELGTLFRINLLHNFRFDFLERFARRLRLCRRSVALCGTHRSSLLTLRRAALPLRLSVIRVRWPASLRL
jgi:hypothetical protein